MRILIISQSTRESRLLNEVAVNHPIFRPQIELTASFGQSEDFWKTSAPDVLIINFPEDSLFQEYFFTKLRRDVQKTQKLLILCKELTAEMLELSSYFSRVRALKEPLDGFTFYRAIVDMTTDYGEGRRQIHPRYMTNQPAKIFRGTPAKEYDVAIKNLSLGGALIESKAGELAMANGEVIKIDVNLNEKDYKFDARIVWAKADVVDDTQKVQLGVSFMNMSEVYEFLLKGM